MGNLDRLLIGSGCWRWALDPWAEAFRQARYGLRVGLRLIPALIVFATWALLAGCSDDTALLKRADKAAQRFHLQLAQSRIDEILESLDPAWRQRAGDDALRAEFTRLSVLGTVQKYERVASNVVHREGAIYVAVSLKNQYRAHTTVEELAFVFRGKKTMIARVSVQVNPKPKPKPSPASAPESLSDG